MKKQIPHRNRSPYGWWIASYMERAVWDGERKPSPESRGLVWENTIILKAKSREAAYKKAIAIGSQNESTFQHNKTNRPGHWEFLGLTSLLPIYEKLEDGAEIMWREYPKAKLKSVASKIKTKRQLEIFDDRKPD